MVKIKTSRTNIHEFLHGTFFYISMNKKYFSLFLVVTLALGMFLPYVTFATATPGDVVINEFHLFGDYWVEFLNTTASDINFASSTWQFTSNNMGPSGVSTTTISSGTIPANGIFTLSSSTLASALATSTAGTLLSLINNGTTIYSMSYGSSTFASEPHMTTSSMPMTSTSSAVLVSSTWSATSSITRGWFNTSPTVDSIIGTINSSGITTNWASSTDSSAITGLYFEKTGAGRLTFGSTLNLTNASTTALLQNLGTKMTAVAGSMKLDAQTALDLKNAGATVAIYGLGTNGYSNLSLSEITVKDDNGNTIATSSGSYPTLTTSSWNGASNNGTFTFTTNHFTEFQFNPVLAEVTAITTPTSSTSPLYTFSSNATGTISFVNGCSAITATSSAIRGNNTVAVGPLTEGVYSTCKVKVTDQGGASSTLAMTAFTIDTTAPVNQNTVFASSVRKQGGASVTIVSSGDTTNNVWFGPGSGTVNFVAGATTTKATSGTSTTILAPANEGTYRLFVLDAAGNKSASSTATLVVDNTSTTATLTPTAIDGPTIRSEKKAAGVPIVVGLGTSGAVATDTLELFLNGAAWTTPKTRVLTAADISAGTYTFTIASGDGWGSDGTKSITARVTDEAGNVGAVSGALSLYLDTAYYPGGGGGSSGSSYTYTPPVTPISTATTTTATSTNPTTQTPVIPTPVTPISPVPSAALQEAQKTLQTLLLQLRLWILQEKAKGNAVPAAAEALVTQTEAKTKVSQITRTLSIGMIGDDVKLLQQFLNNKGFTITASGAGSPGYETMKFGFATKAALVKFQLENGITPASGIFGPKTRAYLESIGE